MMTQTEIKTKIPMKIADDDVSCYACTHFKTCIHIKTMLEYIPHFASEDKKLDRQPFKPQDLAKICRFFKPEFSIEANT